MDSLGGVAATKRRVVVTGKIDLQSGSAGRPTARASPQSYTYGSPVNGASAGPSSARSQTATPVQPRARARVNVAALTGTPTPQAQVSAQDGLARPSSAGGSALGRRALVRSATTPNTVPGFRPDSPGTPTAAAAARTASAVSGSSVRSDRAARSTLGGTGTIKARVNLGASQISEGSQTSKRPAGLSSSPSVSSLASSSSRPLLPSLPITPAPESSPDSIVDGVSPRSSAREIARQARLGSARSSMEVPFPASSSRGTFARSPSIVSDRSSVSYRSSDVASSATGLKSPRLTSHSTPPTEISSYGSLERGAEKQAFSLDQAMAFQQQALPVSPPRRVGEEADAVNGPLSPGRSEYDEAAADAKRDRKIADLEISNKSLMTINRNLEAEAARKDRLIMSLKRQLRASAGIPGGSTGNSRLSTGRTSQTGDYALSTASDEDDLALSENDEVAQEFLRESHVLDGHITRASHAVEALIRKGKEALHSVEQITEGAKGKVLGVLELEEQEQGGEGTGSDTESGEDSVEMREDGRDPP